MLYLLTQNLSPKLIPIGQLSCCCHRLHRWRTLKSSVQRTLWMSGKLFQLKHQSKPKFSEQLDQINSDFKKKLNENKSDIKDTDGYNKVFTFPNILCMTRIGFTPIIGYLVIGGHFSTALTLCAIGGVTDLLDGYIARRYDCVTRLGAILDPLADKLLVATLTVTLTIVHLIPLWLTLLILSRDSLILVGALYLMHKNMSEPKTLSAFIGMSTQMTQKFRPTLISKVNTGFQLSLVAITLSASVFGFADHWFVVALRLATGATTLTSGLNYLKRLKPSAKL